MGAQICQTWFQNRMLHTRIRVNIRFLLNIKCKNQNICYCYKIRWDNFLQFLISFFRELTFEISPIWFQMRVPCFQTRVGQYFHMFTEKPESSKWRVWQLNIVLFIFYNLVIFVNIVLYFDAAWARVNNDIVN